MIPPGEEIVIEIGLDIRCPGCDHLLRGLAGDVASCPGCGRRCDLALLIRRRWTDPWFKAPEFPSLFWPALYLTVGLVLSPVFFVALPMLARQLGCGPTLTEFLFWMMIWLCVLSVFGGWGRLLLGIWRQWPGFEGVGLALLAHLVLLAYLGGAASVVGLVLAMSYGGPRPRAQALAAVLQMAVAVFAARRGERLLAGRCIRRYLRHAG
jgi:hypothetical protein